MAQLGRAPPRFTAVVVLPTPPFWLATAIKRAPVLVTDFAVLSLASNVVKPRSS